MSVLCKKSNMVTRFRVGEYGVVRSVDWLEASGPEPANDPVSFSIDGLVTVL